MTCSATEVTPSIVMPVSYENLKDLQTEVDEIDERVKNEQKKRRFGPEDKDVFVLYMQKFLQQQKLAIDRFRATIGDDIIDKNPWDVLCGIMPSKLRDKTDPEKAQVRFMKVDLSRAKSETESVSRSRRENFPAAALAFHGLFLRSEEDDSIVISWDTSRISGLKYTMAAKACTRETLQKRAERMHEASFKVMSLLAFPLLAKGKEAKKKIGCRDEGRKKAGEASKLFQLTLGLFFQFPKAETLDGVIDVADNAITLLNDYLSLTVGSDPRNTIFVKGNVLAERLSLWETSLKKCEADLTESQEPDKKVNASSEEHDPVIQEMLLRKSSPNSARVYDSTSLTYSDLSATPNSYLIEKDMPSDYNLEILVKPAKMVSLKSSKGGFAIAHSVKLDQPLIKTIDTRRADGTTVRTIWKIEKVAVKVVEPMSGVPVKRQYTQENATCARIIREMRAWSSMKHENILPLLGVWKDVCLDMKHVEYPAAISPWMDDGDLHYHLKENPNILIHERLTYMRDIADALAYMHNHEYTIVHGDLKSNNVLMREGKVYLCDFGLSHMLDGVSGQSSDIHCNERWAAPELLTYRNGTSTRPTCETDMYSFGSIFLEVLTGDWPYGNDLSDNSVKSNRQKDVNTLPDRPVFLAEDSSYWLFMKKCWRMEPLIRPTARQALAVMEAFLLVEG